MIIVEENAKSLHGETVKICFNDSHLIEGEVYVHNNNVYLLTNNWNMDGCAPPDRGKWTDRGYTFSWVWSHNITYIVADDVDMDELNKKLKANKIAKYKELHKRF